MNHIKRITSLILILSMFVGMMAGCGNIADDSNDDNTITLTMWSLAIPQIMGALEKEFPDINFVVNEYAGGNNSMYLKNLLQRDEVGDIFFYTTFYNDSDAPSYLVDLSGYPFLANYDRAILSTLDVNGAIYQVPGPITVRYIGVNKTLFEERGWKIPGNFDEMVDVCRQIHEEAPEITPLGVGSMGMGFVWTLVTSYAQMGFLDTAEGRAAEQGYRMGTSSFRDAFGEGLDMVSQLIDAGAFIPAKFTGTWDVTPKQMGDREAAMCYVMNPDVSDTKLFSGQAKGDPDFGKYNNDEFIILPLFGRNAKNKGLILGTTNTWGISKHLEEKGNEKKLENALRILEYISSEEGQLAISHDPAAIPAIKDLNSEDIPEFMRNLWNDSTNSIKSFFLYTGYEHMMVETGQLLLDAMCAGSSEGVKDEFIRIADQLNSEFLNHQTSSASYGYVENDLSVEQTRKVSCEAFRAAADADIAIASECGSNNGIINEMGLAGRLFKGDIIMESLAVITRVRKTSIVSIDMTGREIREMLENGKKMQNSDGGYQSFYYWAGGAEVIRNEGKITEIKINGNALDDTAVYKVAMLKGDYSQDFAAKHKPTDTGINILDALGSYFKAQGVIKAEQ